MTPPLAGTARAEQQCAGEQFQIKHLPDLRYLKGTLKIEDLGSLLALDCLVQQKDKKLSLLTEETIPGLEDIIGTQRTEIKLLSAIKVTNETRIDTLTEENIFLKGELEKAEIDGAPTYVWWLIAGQTVAILVLGGWALGTSVGR